jgi:hypothetical protein
VIVRRVRVALTIAVIALCVLAASVTRTTFAPGPLALATFAPLPNQAAAGVTFAPLSPDQIGRVQISVSQALVVARRWAPFSGSHLRITVHLGAFADPTNLPSMPAYLVIFDGVIVPNLGPTPGPPNHEDIEVISAVTGHAIEGFSYR